VRTLVMVDGSQMSSATGLHIVVRHLA